jgi:hypothetical protein
MGNCGAGAGCGKILERGNSIAARDVLIMDAA